MNKLPSKKHKSHNSFLASSTVTGTVPTYFMHYHHTTPKILLCGHFKYLYCEWITFLVKFCVWYKEVVQLCVWTSIYSRTICWKDHHFPNRIVLASLWKISWPLCKGLFLYSQFYSIDLYWSFLMPVPPCLNYHSVFLGSFEIS